MTIAIMQPFYLPWTGYFNLIKRSQNFVFLDDVKFEKGSWHTRNKILLNKQEHLITVPVSGSRQQEIQDVCTNENMPWRKKHSRMLEQTYAKHTFGQTMLDTILPIINDTSLVKLSDLNIRIIKALCKQLEIKAQFYLSSDINVSGERSQRLLNLCQHFNDTHYYSPLGSKEYITEDNILQQNNITVEYQDFIPPAYTQKGSDDFVAYLSMIDVIANLGWEQAYAYI